MILASGTRLGVHEVTSQIGEDYERLARFQRESEVQNDSVRKVLLSTGELILKPDHIREPNAPAAWRYYEILTLLRTELQRR